MKHYKFIVPIVLVFLFVASSYMLYSDKHEAAEQYSTAIASAREYRAQGIIVDAEEEYMKGYQLQPTAELAQEIGEFYEEAERKRDAFRWGEQILDEYPDNIGVYDFMMRQYDRDENYTECFRLADKMQKKKLTSALTDEIMNRIRYYYFFNGEFDQVGDYSVNRCPVEINGKWGYVTTTGRSVGKMQYSYAGPFSQTLAPVTDLEGNSYFIDSDGNKKHVVLNVKNVKQLGYISGNMFPLYNGKSWGFYNTDHEHLFGDYEQTGSMGNGVAAVMEKGRWTLVDRTGNKLTNQTYDAVRLDHKGICYRNDRMFVSDGKAWSMIDLSGRKIGDSFEDVQMFNDGTYAAVQIGGKWGFVDKNGTMVIKPQFEAARSFANGLAAVQKNGSWGYIDQDGKFVIAPIFEGAKDFNARGGAFVQMKNHWQLLRLYQKNY